MATPSLLLVASLAVLLEAPKPHAQIGVTLSERLGELPTGADGGGSAFSVDTELRPDITLLLSSRRSSYSLTYEPLFLFRVLSVDELDEQGNTDSSLQLLETGGKPFLLLHNLRGRSFYRFSPRWSWTNDITGVYGEQDFAAFIADGGAAPDSGTTTTNTEFQAIETASFDFATVLTGPLIGRNDFRTTIRFGISVPTGTDDTTNAGGGSRPKDGLCFREPSRPVEDLESLGGISETCQIGFSTATVHPLSDFDILEFQASYDAIDIDPGPYTHAIALSVALQKRFSRTLDTSFRLGLVSNIREDAENAQRDTEFQPFPLIEARVGWQMLNLRSYQLTADLAALMDGVNESVTQEYMSQATLSAIITLTVGTRFSASARFAAFGLGPELGCPPRQAGLIAGDDGSCARTNDSDDAIRQQFRAAEIPDLTGMTTELSVSHVVNDSFNLFGSAVWSARAPHLSRLKSIEEFSSQRELSLIFGLRYLYRTHPSIIAQ